MSHPFGNLLTRYRSRKHGLSQNKIAEYADIDPAVLSHMCRGKRLRGKLAREKVCKIIALLNKEVKIVESEANALLAAAGMSNLDTNNPKENNILQSLQNNEATLAYQEAPPIQNEHLPLQSLTQTSSTPSSKLRANHLLKGGTFLTIAITIFVVIITPHLSQKEESLDLLNNIAWQSVSATWDASQPNAIKVTESNPDEDFGKVESEVIQLDIDNDPVLNLSIQAIDPLSSFTIQIQNAIDFEKHKVVLEGIGASGKHTINLKNLLDDWNGNGDEAITINVWISGEGRSVTFDEMSLQK